MAKWVRSGVLDSGLNDIKSVATSMVLLKAYAAGDSYATVASNSIASVTMATTDYTLSSSGSNRVLTTGAKSATASTSSGATPNLHIGFTDGTANVIWVTDETSDQVITAGNTVNFPAVTYTSNQPT